MFSSHKMMTFAPSKQKMDYFFIGDIHACYYTAKQLIDNYWNRDKEVLVLLGDVVNKGRHTYATLEYLLNLNKRYPDRLVVLKGNNDHSFEQLHREHLTLSAKQKFENYNLDYQETLNWLQSLPLCWKNDAIFASHAGVAVDMVYPVDEKDLSLMFNRAPLKNIAKVQLLGHIVVEKPTYDKTANAWYIDTGAGFGKNLTGVKLNEMGLIKTWITLGVHEKDIVKAALKLSS